MVIYFRCFKVIRSLLNVEIIDCFMWESWLEHGINLGICDGLCMTDENSSSFRPCAFMEFSSQMAVDV